MIKPGDMVICDYRLPSNHQWWVSPLWVGIVEETSTNPAEWNGYSSERHYCEVAGKLRIRYHCPYGGHPEFVQYDSIKSLTRIDGVAVVVEEL